MHRAFPPGPDARRPSAPTARTRSLERLVGPFVFRRETHELAGEYLSDYTVVRLRVELSDEERAAYEREREVFRGFLQARRESG